MEKFENGWEVLGKNIESPPLSDLDVDCVAPPPQETEELDWYQFTARELEILKLVASGISNKQIARELGPSHRTQSDPRAFPRKAKVTNRTELALRVAAAI